MDDRECVAFIIPSVADLSVVSPTSELTAATVGNFSARGHDASVLVPKENRTFMVPHNTGLADVVGP